MSDDVLVRVENVSKRFCRSLKRSLWYGLQDLGSEIGGRRHGGGSGLPQSSADVQLRPDEFWAVKDVSFELRRGECLGLIGRNGAGKTTLLRMLNGLIKPDTGRIAMKGRVGALIALGAGFNPILTGRENIYTNASVLGLTEEEIKPRIEEIIEFAEINDFIDSPVQSYSSGMQVRLGFSIASSFDPDILILDEVLAVGDRDFSHKCFNRLGQIRDRGAATILVSHSEHQLGRFCNRGVVLASGEATFCGEISQALTTYIKNGPSKPANSTNSSIHLESAGQDTKTARMRWRALVSIDTSAIGADQHQEIKLNSDYWIEVVIRSSDSTPLAYITGTFQRKHLANGQGPWRVECTFELPVINAALVQPSFALWNSKRTCCVAHAQGAPIKIKTDPLNIGILTPTNIQISSTILNAF